MSTEDATAHLGQDILNDPLRNKGTAFTLEERCALRIEGHVPPAIETLQDQLVRTRSEFDRFTDPLEKHIYLRSLQDSNETLFLRFVKENLGDTLPIVYTPTVGQAAQEFSRIYRRPRGLFLSWGARERMRDQLASVERPIDVIVATDGQRILGLGDQGAGGMVIPIGKLSLYSAFGGIDPARTLPVMLDVGTDNDERLDDDCYLGERRKRIDAGAYEAFIDQFVDEVKRRWPSVLLQWEDFAQENATPILERHRERILSFNDDIQGTAAVAVAVVNSAVRKLDTQLADQRVCIVGAGSAGTGIGSMIKEAMGRAGAADPQQQIVLLDSQGVVHDGRDDLLDHQVDLAYPADPARDWTRNGDETAVEMAVRYFRPTVLVGASGVPGLFTERAIATMADNVEHPIVLPLSNPTSRAEGIPADILRWSSGRAIVATGSPFEPVAFDGVTHTISQSNNVYVFPGVGLGVVACGATAVTDEMLLTAAEAVADPDDNTSRFDGVLPPIEDVPSVSLRIAKAVARVASESGVSEPLTDTEIDDRIEAIHWDPAYRDLSETGGR